MTIEEMQKFFDNRKLLKIRELHNSETHGGWREFVVLAEFNGNLVTWICNNFSDIERYYCHYGHYFTLEEREDAEDDFNRRR